MPPKLRELPCPKCGENRVEMFSISRSEKSGLQSWCRACQHIYNTSPEAKEYGRIRKAIRNATPEGKEYLRIHNATPKAKEARRICNAETRAANRAKALNLMGHICSSPSCSQDLHEMAWGAHCQPAFNIDPRSASNIGPRTLPRVCHVFGFTCERECSSYSLARSEMMWEPMGNLSFHNCGNDDNRLIYKGL